MDIKPHTIHLWKIPLDNINDQPFDYNKILDVKELKSANNLCSLIQKKQYLFIHATLRNILGLYLNCAPKDILYMFNRYNKKYLAPELNPSAIEFNLSHSHHLAICAITKHKKIGVDIEYLRPIDHHDEIADQILTPSEKLFYFELPEEQRLKAFFKFWSLKEAFVKGVGEGLSFGINNVGFSLFEGRTPSLDILPFPSESKQWSVLNFIPQPGYIGGLATKQFIKSIDQYEVSDFLFL